MVTLCAFIDPANFWNHRANVIFFQGTKTRNIEMQDLAGQIVFQWKLCQKFCFVFNTKNWEDKCKVMFAQGSCLSLFPGWSSTVKLHQHYVGGGGLAKVMDRTSSVDFGVWHQACGSEGYTQLLLLLLLLLLVRICLNWVGVDHLQVSLRWKCLTGQLSFTFQN